jgi:hypothetical protein
MYQVLGQELKSALISIGVLGACGISIPGVNVDLGVALMVGVPLLLASDRANPSVRGPKFNSQRSSRT